MIRRWAIPSSGPAILARRVVGFEKAVIVGLTASSSWCVTTKASSPLFGVPGQGAVSETPAAGLVDDVHHAAGRLNPCRADPHAKDQRRARCGDR